MVVMNSTNHTCKHYYPKQGPIEQCYQSDEDLMNSIYTFIYPKPHEWIFTILYVLVFIFGVSGNFLVCFAVWRNRLLRTTTNYFLVNLAVADFLVIVLCLPPSYTQSIWETWFLGNAMCKVVEYYQEVTVVVSVLTLTAISIERWFAICHPLTFKETRKRVIVSIIVIWVGAHVMSIPRLLIFRENRDPMIPSNLTILLTSCGPDYDMDVLALNYDLFAFVTFYIVPIVVMGYTYTAIAVCLWSSIKTGQYLTEGDQSAVTLQVQSRRRTARMLIVVVVVFILCYLPYYSWNLMRLIRSPLVKMIDRHSVSILTLTAHWMVYLNSSINPVIYNFMSGKFRTEFAKVCYCFFGNYTVKRRRCYGNHEMEPLSTTKGRNGFMTTESPLNRRDTQRTDTAIGKDPHGNV
ncbi:orexin receptor type 2-like isoform X1 [Haliotis rufescens]|uniref:orexin receptor type 2-like isoform X1 n=1 Tax=Haliotis rufescens TaxID=6454 RepID=UPI00201FABED|nr:orexin receptor type 2-like isoform X1 [Haliotis rufescens]